MVIAMVIAIRIRRGRGRARGIRFAWITGYRDIYTHTRPTLPHRYSIIRLRGGGYF